MICHAIQTLCRSWHAFRNLYLKAQMQQASSITCLNLPQLQNRGIKAIILDFDGVLAAYKAKIVAPPQYNWLKDCVRQYGTNRVFILSNNPNTTRKKYFAAHFPEITFLVPQRKKPYPDGILQVMDSTDLPGNAILMVDDRLLTGIMAAYSAKVLSCFISKPLVDYRQNPVHEGYFSLLRQLEQLLLF